MDMKLHMIAHGKCVCVHSLNGPKVSGTFPSWPLSDHVVLKYKYRKWYIVDNKSTLGVYVNGSKVEATVPVALSNGSSISLGPPDSVIVKYECFFPTASKTYQAVQKSKRLRTKTNDTFCSGNNCCERNTSNSFSGQLETSKNLSEEVDLPSGYRTRSKVASVTKDTSNEENEKSLKNQDEKSESQFSKRSRGRKRKINTDERDNEKDELASIGKARLSELEEREKKFSDLQAKMIQQKADFLQVMEEILEKSYTCVICTELYIKAVSLNCAHTFCSYCWDRCKKDRRTCPLCCTIISEEHKSVAIDNCVDAMVEKMGQEYRERRKEILNERKIQEEARNRDNESPSTSDDAAEVNFRSAMMVVGLISRLIAGDDDSD